MSNHTYQITEIVGTSGESMEDAVRSGLARVSKTVRNLDWFEVGSVRGSIAEDGTVAHYQVELRVGFRVEDPS